MTDVKVQSIERFRQFPDFNGMYIGRILSVYPTELWIHFECYCRKIEVYNLLDKIEDKSEVINCWTTVKAQD